MNRRAFLLSLGASYILAIIGAKAHSLDLEASVVGMVEKAAKSVENLGLGEAVKSTPTETWIRKESGLYIFVIDGDGFLLLHPDKRMIGINIRGSRDVQGVSFIRRILKALKKPGASFWSEYMWFDPIDGRTRRKRVYSKKVGDLIVNCGYYLDQA